MTTKPRSTLDKLLVYSWCCVGAAVALVLVSFLGMWLLSL